MNKPIVGAAVAAALALTALSTHADRANPRAALQAGTFPAIALPALQQPQGKVTDTSSATRLFR